MPAVTTSFNTPRKRGEAEITEKKSRFIGVCCPVLDESEASAVLAVIKKQHYNASHHVYAYVLGENGEGVKYSDDGEPSGTGGAPVLTLLRGRNIVNAVIVVTRYYGGTNLGTGGLTRAYGLAAKLALEDAGVVTRKLCEVYELKMPYALFDKFQYEFGKHGFDILGTVYESDITLTARIESGLTQTFLTLAAGLSGGRVNPVLVSKGYV